MQDADKCRAHQYLCLQGGGRKIPKPNHQMKFVSAGTRNIHLLQRHQSQTVCNFPSPFHFQLPGKLQRLGQLSGHCDYVVYHFRIAEVQGEDDTPAQDGTSCDYLLSSRFTSLWHSRCISSLSQAIPKSVQGLALNSLSNPISLQSKFWLWVVRPTFPWKRYIPGKKIQEGHK